MDAKSARGTEAERWAEGDSTDQAASQLANSALLAMGGGFLDGFTYVGHGHVFANAMTGNVVLLGINCFSGAVGSGLRHLPPILMFVLGVAVAKTLETPAMARLLRHPHLASLLIQIASLSALALLPEGTRDMWFTTSIAFVASIQVESFRRVNGRSFNSTYTTGNLRTFAESCFAWLFAGGGGEARSATWDFGVICFAFFAGAAAGGIVTMPLGNRALWIDVVLLGIVAVRVRPRAVAVAVS
ncbi:YoaK family protein [Edaphobacter aggregans]|uniref:YoaK family protein n=1 Tax=Edaphobacter aggregans TaxID=570835 RepID=UPI00068E072D|nr:YoaK family protein [Edaphobacter aggregans]